MHSDHDISQVWALAEGASTDPAEAERLIDVCEECAAAYRDLLTVREAIARQPSPSMTELERARLHRNLWASVEPETPARSTGGWMYRVASVAAAMAVVVGAGYVFTNLGVGGGDDSASETTAAAATEMAAADSAMADSTDSDAGATQNEDLRSTPQELESGGGELEETARFYAGDDYQAVADDFETRAEAGDYAPASDFPCETETIPLAVERATVGEFEVWLVAFGTDGDVASVAIFDTGDCSPIFRSP